MLVDVANISLYFAQTTLNLIKSKGINFFFVSLKYSNLKVGYNINS